MRAPRRENHPNGSVDASALAGALPGDDSDVVHDGVVYGLWCADLMLAELFFKERRIDSVGQTFHGEAGLVKKLELRITVRRQLHQPEFPLRIHPALGGMPEKPNRVLPVDWRDEVREEVMESL